MKTHCLSKNWDNKDLARHAKGGAALGERWAARQPAQAVTQQSRERRPSAAE
jgi:hypothetical protein